MHDEQAHEPRHRHLGQAEQHQPGQPGPGGSRADQQQEQHVLQHLEQDGSHQAGEVPLAHRGDQLAQGQDDPVGERKDQPADGVAKRHALQLHVQAQQTGAREQATDDIEQEGSDLEEHGSGKKESGRCESSPRHGMIAGEEPAL